MLVLVESEVEVQKTLRPNISTFLRLLRARTQDLLALAEGFVPGSQVFPSISSTLSTERTYQESDLLLDTFFAPALWLCDSKKG